MRHWQIAAPQAVYGVQVQISTFNDTDEAITKIRSGNVNYDLYYPSYDQISRLVSGGLISPLNHSYIPNISNVWPSFTNPWYDQEWRYTVPYTIYTTGIGWRNDQVPADIAALQNPYDALWDPAYKGKTAILDDWHTAMAMVLLRQGITDVNTSSAADLKMVGEQLNAMVAATSPKVTVTAYNDLPAGQLGIAQMLSGDIINAQAYLPAGTSTDILRYWFPQDGKGLVDNDLMVILRGGKNPVLAHLFINHMLDPEVAMQNFSAIGYQPPQNSITAESLVQQSSSRRTCARRSLSRSSSTSATGCWNLMRPTTLPGTTCGRRSTPADPRNGGRPGNCGTGAVSPAAAGACQRAMAAVGCARNRLAAGIFHLSALCRAVHCVRTDRPALPHPGPGVEPAAVGFHAIHLRADPHRRPERHFGPALLRTSVYVITASSLCLLIAFPVAYYVARLAGKRKGLLLALLIAPFWISYMMRMFAWVNLLQDDGLVNDVLTFGGCSTRRRLADRPAGGGDPRPGLRLRAVHDPAALRRPRPVVRSRCSRRRVTLAPTGFRRSGG